ncbi:hypothetical protein VTN49DRAFT_2379 [Thermomyces lanuginosus]|uniref:uncharacterized protein n=1 Tax=Thermomyces lanuginosus TaxID=5541 RepID=UPI00374278C8
MNDLFETSYSSEKTATLRPTKAVVVPLYAQAFIWEPNVLRTWSGHRDREVSEVRTEDGVATDASECASGVMPECCRFREIVFPWMLIAKRSSVSFLIVKVLKMRRALKWRCG